MNVYGWDDAISDEAQGWLGWPEAFDDGDRSAWLDAVGDVMTQVARCRLKGLDLWLNMSSSKKNNTPLITVYLGGKPKYAGGETPMAQVDELNVLYKALEKL